MTLGGITIRRIFIAALFVSIFILASGFAGSVSAGVEPSPFRSTFGKLGSIDNNLAEIHWNLEKVLAKPPLDDSTPRWKGASNRLHAIGGKLTIVELRLYEILDPDDPGITILEQLEYLEEAILYRADSIEFGMQEFLRTHNDNLDSMPEAFVSSFFEVLDLINDMQERILQFINPPARP